jgi:hypothetical protein
LRSTVSVGGGTKQGKKQMYQLEDADLDAVAAGAPTNAQGIVQGGLINAAIPVGVAVDRISILNNNNVDVAIGVLSTGVFA